MKFSEIPGNSELKASLIDSFQQNHIAHAQLFYSVEGGAGLPLAMAFATYLLCQNKTETDVCGECASCSKMKKMVHPDVHFFVPKATSSKDSEMEKLRQEAMKNWRSFIPEHPFPMIEDWINANAYENKNVLISKDDSRQIIQTVSMKSFEGSFKIIVIWCPEFMNAPAANALLKVLEEPPVHTIYLMVTHELEALLPTIKSRTQLFTVPPFSADEIRHFLEHEKGVAPDHAQQISRVSGGSLGKAIQEIASDEGLAYGSFRQWMVECLKRDYTKLSERSEGFGRLGKAAQRNELVFALTLIRESILAKAGDESLIARTGEEKKFILDFSKTVPLDALEEIYKQISLHLGNLGRNANAKISLLALSLSISNMIARK